MPLKGGDTRFRSTLKLTAMAREAGVDLGALAKHFRPLRRHARTWQRPRAGAKEFDETK
jgi:hypothetical protein